VSKAYEVQRVGPPDAYQRWLADVLIAVLLAR